MSKTVVTIGPSDQGRRMRLEEFDRAEGDPGYQYELSRGVITVVDVPGPNHFALVNAIRRQLAAYDVGNPGVIYGVASGGECKVLIAGLESERHPDLAIYKTPPPEGQDVWSEWVPEIVIEIVSASSRHRDYDERPEEYLVFGVSEYWIVDADRGEMRVLKRSRGQWAEKMLGSNDRYRTRLLPGFELQLGQVLHLKKPSARKNKHR